MTALEFREMLLGRRERSAHDDRREQNVTIATVLTVLRAVASSVIFVIAIQQRSHSDLLLALGLSMVADFFDGLIARTMSRETVLGAQLDGLADRLAAFFVVLWVVSLHNQTPTILIAVAVWFQFGVADQFLSVQFLRFALWSPDHVYAVEERTWRLNWSPQAKFASNLPIALLAIGGSLLWPALAISVTLVTLRAVAYDAIRRQARLLVPEPHLACASSVERSTPRESYAVDPHGEVRARRVERAHQPAPAPAPEELWQSGAVSQPTARSA
jgi:CDP-diacylglycerol---glycerol-3-phosphate 3-phosphatidyltransferase